MRPRIPRSTAEAIEDIQNAQGLETWQQAHNAVVNAGLRALGAWAGLTLCRVDAPTNGQGFGAYRSDQTTSETRVSIEPFNDAPLIMVSHGSVVVDGAGSVAPSVRTAVETLASRESQTVAAMIERLVIEALHQKVAAEPSITSN